MTDSDPERETDAGSDRQLEPHMNPDDAEVLEGELVEEVRGEVRALREVVMASIDYNVSGAPGLTPSQIAAIDNASPELREVIIRRYDEAMGVEIESDRKLTDLTVKDQQDSVNALRWGLIALVFLACLLVGIAAFGVWAGEPTVSVVALGPVGVAAIGGLVRMALRSRGDAQEV